MPHDAGPDDLLDRLNQGDAGHVVAIVGGGFTGASVAIHALRAAEAPLTVVVFEPRATIGAGIAYDTRDPAYRLNVPAWRMRLYPEDPDHFLRWLQQTGELDRDPDALGPDGAIYARRSTFARYMAGEVVRAAKAAPDGSALAHFREHAVGLRRAGRRLEVAGSGGMPVAADTVVICIGNAAPGRAWQVAPEVEGHPFLVDDPWASGALDAVPADAAVCIIGTGLTMEDVVASLSARGHRGPVVAVSRRGRRPQRVAPLTDPAPTALPEPAPTTVSGTVRVARRILRRHQAAGLNWQSAFEDLRRHVPELWAALPTAERRRLLRRIRPWYDIHRFKVAPQTGSAVDGAVAEGRLTVVRGAVQAIRTIGADVLAALPADAGRGVTGDQLVVSIRPVSGPALATIADVVINCTGPEHDVRRWGDPFIDNLLAGGLGRPDGLQIGLDVDADNRVLDRSGGPTPGLLCVGPLTRGRFGDVMGVNEIGAQVRRVTAHWITAQAI